MADDSQRPTEPVPSDGATVPAASGSASFTLAGGDPGRYTIESEHARGGLGQVMRARDERLRRPVAIKRLLRRRSPDDASRFHREVEITARLQHPSIVPVYDGGIDPDGDPYYAMKLVSGRPLNEPIAAAPTLEGRLALLPHVIAVAEAVAYAHSEGIIHRDLKPANVLVGSFGETIVIDWGLAKRRGDDGAGPASAGGGAGSDGGTVVGTVLGTPAYMPPEQAQGLAVDERADVYALGATLYHVLAGQPPYRAPSSTELLNRLLAEAPPPIEQRAPGVPRELAAVVGKAMARDPAARYPTAAELAADLKRFATGQLVKAHEYTWRALLSRFLRRHRSTVAVAAVLVGALAISSGLGLYAIIHERDVARRERAEAERQRAAAEQVIQFMVADLRNRLQPIGRLDALKGVADSVEQYYQQLSGLDADAQSRRAAALELLAEVHFSSGDPAGAMASFTAGLAVRGQVARAHPRDPAQQLPLAMDLDQIGAIHMSQHHLDAALAWYQTGLTLRRMTCAARPDDDNCLQAIAYSYRALAEAQGRVGEVDAAVASSRAMVDAFERLLQRHPESAAGQATYALGLRRLGVMLEARGDVAGALVAYRRSVALVGALAQRDPANMLWQEDLAHAYSSLAGGQRLQRDLEGALASSRAALAVGERLARTDPENNLWMGNLATAHRDLGVGLQLAGSLAQARAEMERSVEITRPLLAKRTTPGQLSRLAIMQAQIGDIEMDQGDVGAAEAMYRAALAVKENQAESAKDVGWLSEVAEIQGTLGDALLAQGEMDAAQQQFAKGAGIFEELARSGREYPSLRPQHASSYEGTGDVQTARGDLAAALRSYRQGRDMLLAFPADDVNARLALARLEGKVGAALRRQGDVPAAHAELAQALARLDAAARASPEGAALVTVLRVETGRALADLGRLDDALAEQQAALQQRKDEAARTPEKLDAHQGLAESQLELGALHERRGELRPAIAATREGVAIAERTARAAPADVGRQSQLADAYAQLARQLARAGPRAEAAARLAQAAAVLRRVPADRRTAAMRELLHRLAR